MLRVAAWTGGLFAVGSIICYAFSAIWVEPLVLLGLGTILLALGSRGGRVVEGAESGEGHTGPEDRQAA